jgi:hypothetical protein
MVDAGSLMAMQHILLGMEGFQLVFEVLGFGYHGIERGESLVRSGRGSGSGGGGSVEGGKSVGRRLLYMSSYLGKVLPRQLEGYS